MTNNRPEEGEPITLTEEQNQRARAALRAVQEDVATNPHDLLDEWKAAPGWRIIRTMSEDDEVPTRSAEKWVPVSNIIGLDRDLLDDFMDSRMERALRLLAEGQFQPRYGGRNRPVYREICGDFYVTVDGSHRSMACKTVGVDEIYAEVEVVDVDESEYRMWVESRDREPPTPPTIDVEETRSDPGPESKGVFQRFRDWFRG